MENKKVLLGMSGGVDSSVSAILLKEMGYEVVGCTMKLWEGDKRVAEKSIEDAKKVCKILGIEHHVIDLQDKFRCNVINTFIKEYQKANTPNPCIECNKYIKFGEFFEQADKLGCKYVATGHYSRIEYSEKYGQYVLKKAREEKKDQSYFLYTISKEKLAKIIFPLQDYTSKDEIREIAKKIDLPVAEKKDSQEICFIPDGNYTEFLKIYANQKNKKGDIILKDGTKLGEHQGYVNYTIGQRKGLGISYKEPLYVIKLDENKNQVIVGTEKDLYQKELEGKNINWIIEPKNKEIECFAKIRYRAKEAKAKVIIEDNNSVRVKFEENQRAITKGQSVVFYDEDGIVLGGGKII